jgi:type II restriction enzyme
MLPAENAQNYISNSQRIRVMTEYWVNDFVLCPSCGGNLARFGNNQPVAYFYCAKYIEELELKSKQAGFGRRKLMANIIRCWIG